MDTSGQAAEAIVKYSIEGMEYTLKVAGRGAERLAAALLALSRSQQKTKGKTTLNALLKSQKELKVFTIPEKRLKDFARESKRYGVLYCVLKEKKSSKDSLCDILVRAEDAAKINRIVERLELNQVAAATPEPAPAPEAALQDTLEQELQTAENLLEQILSPPQQEQENPTAARTEPSSLSGLGSRPSGTDIETPAANQRASVRAVLEQIRQEQQANPLLHLRETDIVLEQKNLQTKDGKER